jgi:UDP-N-acetylglucosamine transferase subunit ALG13
LTIISFIITIPIMSLLTFVTVGSTQFNDLIETVDTPRVIAALRTCGYSKLSLQIGAGAHEPRTRRGVDWSAQPSHTFLSFVYFIIIIVHLFRFRYKPSLSNDMRDADLIIGHAGSGTITEALRLGKPMVVVGECRHFFFVVLYLIK